MMRRFFDVSDTDEARQALERRVALLKAKEALSSDDQADSLPGVSCLSLPMDGRQLATPGSLRKTLHTSAGHRRPSTEPGSRCCRVST